MTRTEKLRRYSKGRTKAFLAKKVLGVPPQMMTYLLRVDIDKLIEKIDGLPVEVKDAA